MTDALPTHLLQAIRTGCQPVIVERFGEFDLPTAFADLRTER